MPPHHPPVNIQPHPTNALPVAATTKPSGKQDGTPYEHDGGFIEIPINGEGFYDSGAWYHNDGTPWPEHNPKAPSEK
jgi:hypothetical protein